MIVPFKKDPVEFKQRAIFATNVFDLLPPDHPVLYFTKKVGFHGKFITYFKKFRLLDYPASIFNGLFFYNR